MHLPEYQSTPTAKKDKPSHFKSFMAFMQDIPNELKNGKVQWNKIVEFQNTEAAFELLKPQPLTITKQLPKEGFELEHIEIRIKPRHINTNHICPSTGNVSSVNGK